jgi:uncharacterized protein (TIGR04552 family)
MTEPRDGAASGKHVGPSPAASGAFFKSESLRKRPEPRGLDQLSLQDVNEIRLLLRGDSIVDWHRLDLDSLEQVRRLFQLNSVDLEEPGERERIENLRARAVKYIVETLKLHVDKRVAEEVDILELPILASGEGRIQRHACILLKVMHIMFHLDARELRTQLAIADNDVFSLVEGSVVRMFEELRSAGVPVVEFSWSRKTPASLVTKMLVKRQTSAARVFDRLRFRLVVDSQVDLLPTLHVMLHRCIPFNYVVPGQTVNTLLDVKQLDAVADRFAGRPEIEASAESPANEFSGAEFRILNFIADLPVRVDDLLWDRSDVDDAHGRVVFVLAEFQIMDRVTSDQNDTGESAHVSYKNRQHARVKERLLRAPSHVKDDDDLDSEK